MPIKFLTPQSRLSKTANLNQSAIKAIVTIFLHLIKIDPKRINSDRLHYLLSNLHQNFAHTEFDYNEMQKAVQDLIPVMDAVRIIQHEFTYPEKLIFLLRLLQIVYHEPEFNILESLEVIELVDYLYIKLEHYEAILDFVEDKTVHLHISPELLLKDRLSVFKNCLNLASGEDADVLIPVAVGTIVLINFEGFVLMVAENNAMILVNDASVTPGLTLKITEGDSLSLIAQDKKVTLDYSQILQLSHNKKACTRRTFSLELGSAMLTVSQISNLVNCTVVKGRILVGDKELKTKQTAKLELTDVITAEQQTVSIADIITGRWHSETYAKPQQAVYLERAEDFYLLNNRRSKKSLALLCNQASIWTIEPLASSHTIYLNQTPLLGETEVILAQDILSVDNDFFIITRGMEVIRIEQEIRELEIVDLFHKFESSASPALNHVQFKLKAGEIMSIMGPSGSGKTTLLKTLLGEIYPEQATILVNGNDFSSRMQYYQSRISYVPQDDLLFANLTVYENLYYCSRLRLSGRCPGALLHYKIGNILRQVGLYEKRNMMVGDTMNKKLSGGERKRLNIALELVTDPQIIIMDEPTSGLSSKDSEKLMQFMLTLKRQGKIIISTIHQPNPELFSYFDKLLFLDYGGTQVYFGDVSKVFDYFNEEFRLLLPILPGLNQRKKLMMPEFLFDILEAPMDENNPERRFPPSYWEDKYKRERIVRLIQNAGNLQDKDTATTETGSPANRFVLRKAMHNFFWLLVRNLKNRITSKANLIITFLGTPLLCFITALVLRYAPPGSDYQFSTNENYPMYLFISIIIFIFLGLAGSIDEILSERRIILREAQLNISMGQQLMVKSVTLSIFTLIQTIEYYVISGLLLGVEGAFLPYLIYLMLSGGIGFSFGLLCSTWMKDRKAVINVLPLILIPQILFAGAVIPFDKMNRWLKINTHAELPEFCQLIPSRWLFEGFCTAHTDLNTWDKTVRVYNTKITKSRGNVRWQLMDKKNAFTSSRSLDNYQNQTLHKSVNIQTGAYFNHGGSPFLSRYSELRGKRWSTWKFNLLVMLGYILMLHICCLFSLYSYRRKQT